jgi:recombinational DNA repair protein (RecF pathway)
MGRLCDSDQAGPLTVSYMLRLLEEVGSLPQFEECVGCSRPLSEDDEAWFSSFDGGPLCQDCEGAYVEKRTLPAIALPALRGRPAHRPGEAAAAFTILNYHISHLMGRAPRLAAKLAWANDTPPRQ